MFELKRNENDKSGAVWGFAPKRYSISQATLKSDISQPLTISEVSKRKGGFLFSFMFYHTEERKFVFASRGGGCCSSSYLWSQTHFGLFKAENTWADFCAWTDGIELQCSSLNNTAQRKRWKPAAWDTDWGIKINVPYCIKKVQETYNMFWHAYYIFWWMS